MSEEYQSASWSSQHGVALKVSLQIGSVTSMHDIGTYFRLHFEN